MTRWRFRTAATGSSGRRSGFGGPMLRGLAILLVLATLGACGGPEEDRAEIRGASLQLDRPAGRQFDGGLQGAQPTSPAQELFLLLMVQEQLQNAGSSPDPLPGIVSPVGSSPDPLPGLCNGDDCVGSRGR